ncbi:MAG: hypothetical protein EBZ54_04950, partial [Actinobacteria bacterium]|nr:hypothetical protein [Actinomycetota bacterium]
MPKRNDLKTILIIGSGPIVIGQACEFDYSGTQACRVLREEGYRVVLANSNPATIMTDPDFADRTYIEPLTVEVLKAIIEREKPDAVLPTLGGQTALNLAMALHAAGVVGHPGTPELIGANAEAIATAEDRDKFKQAMIEIGLSVPRSGIAHSMAEADTVLAEIGLPVIIRPAYILGGRGTGIAHTKEQFVSVVSNGLSASPINEVLIESSIAGWKEYELEVMRDRADNCVIICSIENTLDEISNDITKKTPASFEPTIDYVVTKVPRWAFEKFPGTPGVLGTQMQSVGESMAIGRTFTESLQKALRSLENGHLGLNCDPSEDVYRSRSDDEMLAMITVPTPERLFQVGECLRRGIALETVYDACKIDPWFLDQMSMIIEERHHLAGLTPASLTSSQWRRAKRLGFADAQLAYLWKTPETEVRRLRIAAGVLPTYKAVDTCSAEFSAQTPYHYSTYEDETEVRPADKPQVIILGSGPNRIGQGIEFDYCCVHASFALRDAGFETIMVNCNPETVSTDYDTSDRLYFEPLTHEDVMNVIEAEVATSGREPHVIVGLGGQTPLKLAGKIPAHLVAGTSPASIDLAEDREK